MKKKPAIMLGLGLIAISGLVAFTLLAARAPGAMAGGDPRQETPLVQLAMAGRATDSERRFTGIVGAKVESNLGFRVPGKIIERLVNAGQQVKAGQPLLRIDETDLRLTLVAKRNAVAAARAVLVQASADEKRYAALVKNGLAATPQRYEQAKAALDTATAQLAAAEAEAQVAENEATYSILVADADGTVIETLGEPGQVVSAGQTVIRLAQAGSREAVVALPEIIRPAIGSVAEASVYGSNERYTARLRQLSDSADAQTRTYEARYVLDGEGATAPLGATVTIRLGNETSQPELQVPLGAVLDDGEKTGVWLLDRATSTVHFRPIGLVRVNSETAVVSGLDSGDPVVSLGAHLLQEGARVRTASESRGQ
ncbi:efflux RND transporter periplasmic adaptor subunit [Methylovirgula sp. 4M-Z18]|uniref:efflux RND transporter periplasmic adaptor subunit n=1 Tax=Methylovirgula sp. 4M-Z18 TaxID=2293567 RepID=UPI000E2E6234|nr:efflux RND transporter periplasmic adaptor subunit [Methylovirgula sp. 4M-Z18]RFB76684.1 efflux RND transporter periplasmic adaptor subunit [Methylovirgula sp. 4M-Z18]